MKGKPRELHFTAPPTDKLWSKAIAQLNRDREIYDAGRAGIRVRKLKNKKP